MQRNGKKCDKKIQGKRRQQKKNLNFFGQKLSTVDMMRSDATWVFPQKFLWCFELPLLFVEKRTRTYQKRHKKLKK
jgi:hypothetical protein